MNDRDTPADLPSEEVDEIVAAWQRERPDLDFAPLHVLSRVRRLARRLERARRNAFAAAGLEPWEFDVLSALRRSGAPYRLSPTTLTRATMVTSGTMTNRIDRLVARGLVERRSDEHDGRSVAVCLTPLGQRHADAAIETLLVAEGVLLDVLDDAERQNLVAALRQLAGGLPA